MGGERGEGVEGAGFGPRDGWVGGQTRAEKGGGQGASHSIS